jgi:hypothetical protein
MKKPNADLFAWSGLNFELLGRLSEAEEALVKALEIQPEYPGLKEKLEALRQKLKTQKDMVTTTVGNFQIRFVSESGNGNAEAIGQALMAGYERLSRDLEFTTNQPILVICFTRADWQKASTISYAAGIYDGTINVRVDNLEDPSISVEKTMVHEYTHYVIDRLSGGKAPLWINEGLADLCSDDWGNYKEGIFRKMVVNNQVLPWDGLSFGHQLTGSQVTPHYIEAYTIADYLVESQGFSQVRFFLSSLKEGQSVDEALQGAFQDGQEGLQKAWLKWVKEKFQ